MVRDLPTAPASGSNRSRNQDLRRSRAAVTLRAEGNYAIGLIYLEAPLSGHERTFRDARIGSKFKNCTRCKAILAIRLNLSLRMAKTKVLATRPTTLLIWYPKAVKAQPSKGIRGWIVVHLCRGTAPEAAQMPANQQRLDSWKEIATFFGRDQRTVKRWEKTRLLPVHRIPGGQRSGVFAYPHELTRWLNSSIYEGTEEPSPVESGPDPPPLPMRLVGGGVGQPQTKIAEARLAWPMRRSISLIVVASVAFFLVTGTLLVRGSRHASRRAADTVASNLPQKLSAHSSQATELFLKGTVLLEPPHRREPCAGYRQLLSSSCPGANICGGLRRVGR